MGDIYTESRTSIVVHNQHLITITTPRDGVGFVTMFILHQHYAGEIDGYYWGHRGWDRSWSCVDEPMDVVFIKKDKKEILFSDMVKDSAIVPYHTHIDSIYMNTIIADSEEHDEYYN